MTDSTRRDFLKMVAATALIPSLPSLAFSNDKYRLEKKYADYCVDFVNDKAITVFFSEREAKKKWQWTGIKGLGDFFFCGDKILHNYSYDSDSTIYYHFSNDDDDILYLASANSEMYNITLKEKGRSYHKIKRYTGNVYNFYVPIGVNNEVIRSMIKERIDMTVKREPRDDGKPYFIKDVLVHTDTYHSHIKT